MSAHEYLRQNTRQHHAAVDALFAPLDLAKPEDYGMFLTAHGACLGGLEDALDPGASRLVSDWAARRRAHLLAADLEEMGLEVGALVTPPFFATDAEVLGGIYVLEGSRLGGAVLQRGVATGAPARFLRAANAPGAWRNLLGLLDDFLKLDHEREAAAHAARSVFNCFAAAGREKLERRFGGQ